MVICYPRLCSLAGLRPLLEPLGGRKVSLQIIPHVAERALSATVHGRGDLQRSGRSVRHVRDGAVRRAEHRRDGAPRRRRCRRLSGARHLERAQNQAQLRPMVGDHDADSYRGEDKDRRTFTSTHPVMTFTKDATEFPVFVIKVLTPVFVKRTAKIASVTSITIISSNGFILRVSPMWPCWLRVSPMWPCWPLASSA